MGRKRQCLARGLARQLEVASFSAKASQRDPGSGAGRVDLNYLVEAGLGLVEPALFEERDPQALMGIGRVRVVSERQPVRPGRLIELLAGSAQAAPIRVVACGIGVENLSPFKPRSAVGISTPILKKFADVETGRRPAVISCQRLLIAYHGVVESALKPQYVTQGIDCLGKVRRDRQRAPAKLLGLIQYGWVAHFDEDVGQIRERRSAPGLEPNRRAKHKDGVIETTHRLECVAQVVMRRPMFGPNADGFAKGSLGVNKSSLLVRQQPHRVPGVRQGWIELQALAHVLHRLVSSIQDA